MFMPLYDTNPLKTIPLQYVTIALIVVNAIVFAVTAVQPDQILAASFAVVPVELSADAGFGDPAVVQVFDGVAVPELFTLVSYQFLHGDLLHLIGNMLFLWVFGDNVEDAMGHLTFLGFYLACGVFAALAHMALTLEPGSPLIGASGAVAGVVAAYLVLHPKVNLWVLVARVLPLQVKAFWALGAWVAMQFVMVVLPSVGPTAWWAHIGGLVAGAILVVFMRRADVPLFDQTTHA